MIRRGSQGRRATTASARAIVAAAAVLLLGMGSASAGAWCDLLFKDVADTASAVALARYDIGGPAGRLPIVELIRGELASDFVSIDPEELRGYRLRDGQMFVLALDSEGRPIRAMQATGFCEPVNILPIHRGAVRARFRPDYDGRSRALPLDELRAELVAAVEDGAGAH